MSKFHNDQAAGLRRLFRRAAPTVVAIVGGQAASGATRIACALARELDARGLMVTFIDEHRSARGAANVLDIRFRYDLWQVCNGDVVLDHAAVAVNDRLRYAAAARLAQYGDRLDDTQRANLERCWQGLSAASEVIVIDAKVHGGGKFSPLAAKAGVVAVVTGSGSAAVMGSYLTLKSIAQKHQAARLGVVVNRAANAAQAAYIGENMRGLMKQQLGRATAFFGYVPLVPAWRGRPTSPIDAGADLTALIAALSAPGRYEHCSKHDKDPSIETAAGGYACAAVFAT